MTSTKLFLEHARQWIIYALVINSIFLLDLIAHIIFFGFGRLMKKNKEYLWEFILQIGAQFVTVLFIIFRDSRDVKITRFLSIIMLLRNLRLMSLLWELADFRKIVETFKRFSMPFATIMFSLYSVMFFYAVIGEFLFAGKVTVQSVETAQVSASTLYYLINFNDFYASMVTLFHVLVVNNWNQTTDMYCAIIGNNWPRLYFTTFWIICTLIMLNIVISFVLEIYGSIGDEIHDYEKKLENVRKLMDFFDKDDQGEQLANFVREHER